MQRSFAPILTLGLVVAVGIAASATARSYAICLRGVEALAAGCESLPLFDLDGTVLPRELPKRELAPISLELRGSVANHDGTYPPALREAVVDFDKNGSIDARGLPACGFRQLETHGTKAARRLCRESIVGSGMAHIGTEIPGQEPIPSPLTLFNGGARDGVTTLFVHGSVAAPNPVPIVTTVKVTKAPRGRYGLHSVWKVPEILGGNGSILDFRFEIERRFSYRGEQQNYLMARCFDGRLTAKVVKAVFKQEPRPGSTTVMSGTVINHCTPTG